MLDLVFLHPWPCMSNTEYADLTAQGNFHEQQTKGNIFLKMQIIFINNFMKSEFLKGSIAVGGACRR